MASTEQGNSHDDHSPETSHPFATDEDKGQSSNRDSIMLPLLFYALGLVVAGIFALFGMLLAEYGMFYHWDHARHIRDASLFALVLVSFVLFFRLFLASGLTINQRVLACLGGVGLFIVMIMSVISLVRYINDCKGLFNEEIQTRYCEVYLGRIETAKTHLAKIGNLQGGEAVAERDLEPYWFNESKGRCPAGGRYIINPIGRNPVCPTHGDLLQAKEEEFERKLKESPMGRRLERLRSTPAK